MTKNHFQKHTKFVLPNMWDIGNIGLVIAEGFISAFPESDTICVWNKYLVETKNKD